MERDLLLLYIMAVFTGVAAVALVLQLLFLMNIYRAVKVIQERSVLFLDRWAPVADSSLKMIEQVRKQSDEILTKLNAVADSTKTNMERVDVLLTDVSETARIQMARVDQAVEHSLDRLKETTGAIQKTVLVPVRQVRALALAVSAVFDHLVTGRRPTVDRVTIDEEMFI